MWANEVHHEVLSMTQRLRFGFQRLLCRRDSHVLLSVSDVWSGFSNFLIIILIISESTNYFITKMPSSLPGPRRSTHELFARIILESILKRDSNPQQPPGIKRLEVFQETSEDLKKIDSVKIQTNISSYQLLPLPSSNFLPFIDCSSSPR